MLAINERLIYLRETRKVTRTKIYTYIGVTRQTYNSYERGKAAPSLKVLIKLAEFYNVSLDFIVGRSPLEQDKIVTCQNIHIANLIMDYNFEPEAVKILFDAIKNIIDKSIK